MKIRKVRTFLAILGSLAALAALFSISFFEDYHGTPVTEKMWVNVANLEGVENQNHKFEFGEKGLITPNGKVEYLHGHKNQVLLRYLTPKYTASDNELPKGTIFWLSEEKFNEISRKN